MDYVKRFKVLLSGPGDVTEELKRIEEGIRTFNRTTGEIQGMLLDVKHWSTDSHPQTGDRPQELLNQQFIRDCDLVIAVFGTRFGSPTGKYQSGTEEEIEEMIAAKKPVFLYFSEVPRDPSTINIDQFNQVKAFREKYQAHTLYGVFKSLEEIEKKIHAGLSLYFIRLEEPPTDSAAVATASESQLEVRSQPVDDANPQQLKTTKIGRDTFKNIFGRLEANLKKKIESVIKLGPLPPKVAEKMEPITGAIGRTNISPDIIAKFNKMNSISFGGRTVEVEDNVKKYISSFAKLRFAMDLPDSFFEVGELREAPDLGMSPWKSKPSITGDEHSQKKFSLICDIERDIHFYLGFEQWAAQFEGFHVLQPVLVNNGSRFDEDITVDLFFPKKAVANPKDFKSPHFECSAFVTEKVLPYSFRAEKSFNCEGYGDYPEYTPHVGYRPVPLPMPKSQQQVAKEREEEYGEWFDDNFLYELDEDGDKQVVSCTFSYLRQHTSMYFPAVLLVKHGTGEVTYRIRSKHSAKVFSGTLKFTEND